MCRKKMKKTTKKSRRSRPALICNFSVKCDITVLFDLSSLNNLARRVILISLYSLLMRANRNKSPTFQDAKIYSKGNIETTSMKNHELMYRFAISG